MADTRNYLLGTLGSESKLSNNDANLQRGYIDGVIDTRLPNGNLVRYKLYKMRTWDFTYSWLYGEKKYIYDGGMSRNDLLALYEADIEQSFLEVNDQGAQTSYTVRFEANSWSEELLFRNNDKWAWKVAFKLVQTK